MCDMYCTLPKCRRDPVVGHSGRCRSRGRWGRPHGLIRGRLRTGDRRDRWKTGRERNRQPGCSVWLRRSDQLPPGDGPKSPRQKQIESFRCWPRLSRCGSSGRWARTANLPGRRIPPGSWNHDNSGTGSRDSRRLRQHSPSRRVDSGSRSRDGRCSKPPGCRWNPG